MDEEFNSIDEAALVGSEEQDSLRNFIGGPDASKRDHGSLGGYEPRHLFFGQTKLVVTWGRHRTGADDTLGRLSLVADYLNSGVLVCPLPLATRTAYSYYLVGQPETMQLPWIIRFRHWLRAEATATVSSAPLIQTQQRRTKA
jgi:DNA-binding transcriptional LysR family regulator